MLFPVIFYSIGNFRYFNYKKWPTQSSWLKQEENNEIVIKKLVTDLYLLHEEEPYSGFSGRIYNVSYKYVNGM
mgnify:CR=1 FL=1